jgi:hypothetical protein
VGRTPTPITIVEAHDVAAAVSDVDADVPLDETDARTHLHVLTELLTAGPVLPVRMGTVVTSNDEVRSALLEPIAAQARAQLDALDGLVELHVDADDDESRQLADLAREGLVRPQRAGGLTATLEAGRQIADVLTDHRRRLAARIVEQLRPIAVDDLARSELSSADDPLLRWAFLVRARDVTRFDDAVDELRTQFPAVAFRHVGPLPAAHFADRVGRDASRSDATPRETDSFAAHGRWGF